MRIAALFFAIFFSLFFPLTAFAQISNATPTVFFCVGNNPQPPCATIAPTQPSGVLISPSVSPSVATENPSISPQPSTLVIPTTNPCTGQANVVVKAIKSHTHIDGLISDFIQFLLQLLLDLLKLLFGGSIPQIGTPQPTVGPTQQPTISAPVPSTGTPALLSPTPTVINPCVTPTSTVSTVPSTSNQPTAGTPTSSTTTTVPTQPVTSSGKYMAIIMYAPWISLNAFKSMVAGNLVSGDQIKYRVTNYPTGYDASAVAALKTIKASVPGLKLGVDIAYSAKIVQYAAQIKSQGFDFVEYDLEAGFDGSNDAASAANDVAKIKAAADAVHAQGMTFRVTPGRPNSNTFLKANLLGNIAKMVDYYQIQNQSTQTQGPATYSSFTAAVTKQLKQGNSHIIVTAQVSPAQGAQSGKSVLQTMEDDMTASIKQSSPGNIDGAGMWIGASDVSVATSFFSWFHKNYL